MAVAQAKGGVREVVLMRWLEGDSLREIAESVLNTPLMIDSVLRCKRWIAATNMGLIDVDDPTVTHSICAGFLDYIEDVYNECESLIGD